MSCQDFFVSMSVRWEMGKRLDLKIERKIGTCTWCKIEVKHPRRTWCSDKCVYEYQIRTNPRIIRSEVRKRDRSVCQGCGLDCLWLARFLRSLESLQVKSIESAQLLRWVETKSGWFPTRHLHTVEGYVDHPTPSYWSWRMWFCQEVLGLSRADARRRSYWEADHIVPVVEGGGRLGLENLQTLCLWCHRAKSAHDGRRRKRR